MALLSSWGERSEVCEGMVVDALDWVDLVDQTKFYFED
jgi:hypothetical protein